MIELVRVNLHDIGARYVLECLQGEGPLEAAVHTHWNPQAGAVFALVPKGTKHDLAALGEGGLALDASGTNAVPVAAEAAREMVRVVQNHFEAGAANICILEDQIAGASDRWLTSAPNRYVVLDGRVFYPIFADDSEEALLWACRSACHYDAFLGVVSRVSADEIASWKQPGIGPRDLEAVAANPALIVASAYDCESYAFWERSAS